MPDIAPLPRLAAMYLTTGHRVPDEVLTILATRPGEHPLDGWECPLDATRQLGERAEDGVRVGVPEA